jgi:hypothetical protein
MKIKFFNQLFLYGDFGVVPSEQETVGDNDRPASIVF